MVDRITSLPAINKFMCDSKETNVSASLDAKVTQAKEQLDAHVRKIVQWHFSPDTGTPFWLDKAKEFKFNPLKDVQCFDDLKLFPFFEDEWLRGGPVRRWVPRGHQSKPVYVFETGGTTGIPKSRVVVDDFRIDYEMFSAGLPDQFFPKGANWLMLGPSGPRRLRLAVEHMCQHRGGICFCVDLDPRWVIKLIKKGWMEHLKAYQEHVIDQAMTVLSAGHDVKCMFTTPKLLDSLAQRLEKEGSSIAKAGITGVFCGGTEMTSQWIRFAIEEYLGPGVYIAPTYGNTLMGLAASDMPTAGQNFKIAYYAPQPRAVAQVVDFKDYNKVVEYGQTGRVLLTTLTDEFFVPRFAERDEGEREMPYDKYPWDGVSGVRPFHEIAAQTTVGVY
jgi:phenylacetate-coenzyme A ligase PaaK-like adenylate-forming protein